MKVEKFFNVLVLGGALLASGNLLGSEGCTPDEIDVEPALAFCAKDDPNTCEVDEDGNSVVREGFVCCWGTSCE